VTEREATRRLWGYWQNMDDKSEKILRLRTELALLKKDEERLRYLVTSVRSSPEYRREATAKLEDARRRIYSITLEINGNETSN
jgi:hypothetical protein